MTEPDTLSCKIHELKEWQKFAWRRVADPLLTAFERREIRNQIRVSDEELRRCLAMMSGRLRFRSRAVEDTGDNLMLPGVTALGVVPEESRDPGCPIKYKLVGGPMGAPQRQAH